MDYFSSDVMISPQKMTAEKIFEKLETACRGDVVFLDVDDTLIQVCGLLFTRQIHEELSEGTKFIDACKANAHLIANFSFLLGSWRQRRKVRLIHPHWPEIIKNLVQKNVQVYGLTQMDTGPCGPILCTQQWRYNELFSMDIVFTSTLEGQSVLSIGQKKAGFYKGIFMTGMDLKSTVVASFLERNPVQKVFFVDDRVENLQDVGVMCHQKHMPFESLWIAQEAFELPPVFASEKERLDFFALQKKSFLDGHWLNDEEAFVVLRRLTNV